jgi:hypothetical protein
MIAHFVNVPIDVDIGVFALREVWHHLIEQAKTGRNLTGGHIPFALDVFDQCVEDIAVSDFIPVFVRHGETG